MQSHLSLTEIGTDVASFIFFTLFRFLKKNLLIQMSKISLCKWNKTLIREALCYLMMSKNSGTYVCVCVCGGLEIPHKIQGKLLRSW